MSATPNSSIELLAPARDAEIARAAIDHGADAVYIGATDHGARAAAANSVSDIAGVCDYAHRFDARVYVTLNTLVYDSELRGVERLIKELYRAGVDALIVQDLGILRMDIPPIALHASTQCDIRTPERARFLQDLGFSQLVLPRELTIEEIRAMRRAVDVPLEAFVHGALCVSYSGDCRASLMSGGRSANRGECAQICRLPFDLVDSDGNVILKNQHLLSLRDLNRVDDLAAMIDAGISSLKIEGRLKDINYVKNAVSAYDRKLRELNVSRTSSGTVSRSFVPDLSRGFNRGYTSHFLRSARPEEPLANFLSPKSLGEEIARVGSVKGRRVTLTGLSEPLSNGDGLNFTASDGSVVGFRVNRFEPPATVVTAESIRELRPGMAVRRNFDKKFTDTLSPASTAKRTIPVCLRLRRAGGQLILEETNSGVAATLLLPEPQRANTPQEAARNRVMAKLGDTPYSLAEYRDELGDEFVAASQLTMLRRRLVEALDASRACRFERPLRAPEKPEAIWPEGTALSYHNNVANRLAREVYRDHGVTGDIAPAAEVSRPEGEVTVMTTRYCLRRELGACLKTPGARKLPARLWLRNPRLAPLSLDFDCANCLMNVKLQN